MPKSKPLYIIGKDECTLTITGALKGQDVIDLSVINDAPAYLRVVARYTLKTYATPELVGAVVMGLQEALKPDQFYCRGGMEQPSLAPHQVNLIVNGQKPV